MRRRRRTSRQRPPARATGDGPPQRGERRDAEHRDDASGVLGGSGLGERDVELGFALPDAAAPGEDRGPDESGLGPAGGVVEVGHGVDGLGGEGLGVGEAVGLGDGDGLGVVGLGPAHERG